MSRIKIHMMHCGRVRVSPSLPFGDGNIIKASGLFLPKKDKIWLPVTCVYIEHPKTKILVDTGWNRMMSPAGVLDNKAQATQLGRMLVRVSEGYVEKGMTASEQLARMGVRPEDLDFVVLSHLDCDHVGGLRELVGAKHIMTSEDEIASASSWLESHTRYTPSLWKDTGITGFQYSKSDMGPVGESYDMLGDGTVQLVHIPGQSKGLFATLVSNNGKRAMYFSDGGYATRSWKELILPGICEDKKAAQKSLEWIKTVSESPDCIDSFACHDPEIAPHITTL